MTNRSFRAGDQQCGFKAGQAKACGSRYQLVSRGERERAERECVAGGEHDAARHSRANVERALD